MSLEKLAYYAQAFHLAVEGGPLFSEEVQAWKWGPVIPSIYQRYVGNGSDSIIPDDRPAPPLGKDHEDFLREIVGFFCQHTAVNLSRATHLEEPWIDASNKKHGNIISQETMKDYYRSLMDEGEVALSRHELLDTISEPRWSSYYVAGISRRMMAEHPFYKPSLAKTFAEPVPSAPKLPKTFFDAAGSREFIEFRPDEAVEDVIKRSVSNA
jgi:uncharacterized phage-associated protein